MLLLSLLCQSHPLLYATHVSLCGLVGLGKGLSYGAFGQVGPGGIVASLDGFEPSLFGWEPGACVEVVDDLGI